AAQLEAFFGQPFSVSIIVRSRRRTDAQNVVVHSRTDPRDRRHQDRHPGEEAEHHPDGRGGKTFHPTEGEHQSNTHRATKKGHSAWWRMDAGSFLWGTAGRSRGLRTYQT